MKADDLLRHYARIADAPAAVARLRRFILDLAVRGKLLRQEPTDEPAASLLNWVASEKARLLKSGEISKEKALTPFDDVGIFDLPASWQWTQLGNVTSHIQRGKSPKYAMIDGSPIISQRCVQWRGLDMNAAKLVTLESLENYEEARFLRDGDLLWNSTGTGTIGRIILVCNPPARLVCDSHVTVVRCLGVLPEYIRTWLRSDSVYSLIEDRAAGSTNQVELTAQMAINQIVPLPPLAEQHRIVAKVDELMALCDRLEAARAEREAARDRLAAASLARLNAPDAPIFHDDARFVLDALLALTARTDQIKRLRQTILNLAVSGRLVPQNPNDEPTSVLVQRIKAENVKLLLTKGIRAQKVALPVEEFEANAGIPDTWRHAYLQDLAYQVTDGTHLTPKYTEQGKPFLSAQNIKPFKFMPERHRFVSEEDFYGYRANRQPGRGDILMTRVGAGIGEAAVLDSDFEFAFYVSLCLIKIPNQILSAHYLVLWLNSSEGRDSSRIRTYGKGASQGNLNLGLIRTFKIPIPPLAEQLRIVAKVDELMSLCDRLEASLASGDDHRRRLLEALLQQALQPTVTLDAAA